MEGTLKPMRDLPSVGVVSSAGASAAGASVAAVPQPAKISMVEIISMLTSINEYFFIVHSPVFT
jgi:hypothetical protein